MRLFRLIHIVTVYFWDYSGPFLLPLAIMVAILLFFKWYDKKFLSPKNEKFATCSEVSEEMVKFINVQQFVDERSNDVNTSAVLSNEASSFTISPTVGTLDRNESYDLSQEALRKEAIAALNSSTENAASISSFESASCDGDRKICFPSVVAKSKILETYVNNVKFEKENRTKDISVCEEQSLENDFGSSLDNIYKLNSNCNIDSKPGLEQELSNGFGLCTEPTNSGLSFKDHREEYLPPIIITGKSTDLDSINEVQSGAITICSSSAFFTQTRNAQQVDTSNENNSLTTTAADCSAPTSDQDDSKRNPNGGKSLESDCSGHESCEMTDHTKKSSAADILSKGGSDPDLLGSGYEDKNNNKDKNLLEEKSSEGGEEQEEAKGRSGHDEDEKESEEEDDDDDEEVSSEVDDSDDEVISYDLESLHQDLDDDVTASYTVKLSSQISTPDTSVESTPKHSAHSLPFAIFSLSSKSSPLKSCLKEASECFLGAEETAVLTPPRVKFGEIKVTEVEGLGSCAGESCAPQMWNCGEDSSSDDNLY